MELEQIGFSFDDDGVVEMTTESISLKNKQTLKKSKINYNYLKLYDIYSQLYDLLGIDVFDTRESIIIGDLIAYPEDNQAEVMGTQLLDLEERIRRNNDYLENRKKELARPCGVR